MEVQLYVYDLSKVGLANRSVTRCELITTNLGDCEAGMTEHIIVSKSLVNICGQMSASLLGIQIDAVYHTALVFGGIEYFFGAGVQTSYPGATHHGKPMEVIPMGTTQLPVEVILEYLESLKEIYTMEVRYLLCRLDRCAMLTSSIIVI